jgi:hypothetical protein
VVLLLVLLLWWLLLSLLPYIVAAVRVNCKLGLSHLSSSSSKPVNRCSSTCDSFGIFEKKWLCGVKYVVVLGNDFPFFFTPTWLCVGCDSSYHALVGVCKQLCTKTNRNMYLVVCVANYSSR